MTQITGAKGFGARLAQERRLKSAQERRDIEKKDVAKALGVSNSTYGRWEAGTIPSDDDTMEALAKYFGVTAAWLHYGQEPREPVPVTAVTRGAKPTRPGRGGHGEDDRRTGT